MEKVRVSRRLLKFALVGLAGTFLDFAVFSLSLLLGLAPSISRAMGYCAGTLWAFFLNRSWVFNSTGNLARLLPFILTYLVSGSAAVLIQSLGPTGANDTTGVFLAFGFSVVVGALINFLSLRYFVFRD
jgi:putative flippase GtrA